MKKFIIPIYVILLGSLHAQVNPAVRNQVKPVKQNERIRAAMNMTTVNLDVFEEWLCPYLLLRGDRESDGHGPKVKSEVRLRIGSDSSSILAEFYLWAQETQADWSTTEARWIRKVYDAPYGVKIKRIVSDTASRTQFISPKAGYQIFVPGTDVARTLYTFLDNTDVKSAVLKAFNIQQQNRSALSNLITHYVDKGNQIIRVPPVEGTLVKYFYIVGDTGGEDISSDDNCNDDTRIHKIEFFPVRLELSYPN